MSSNLKRKANAGPAAAADGKKPRPNGSITSFFGAPKPGPAAGTAAAKAGGAAAEAAAPAKFDKARWVASLTDEQRGLLQLEIDTLDESWLAHLRDEVTSKEFLELKRFLNRETAAGKKWFPPQQDVYSWSRHTPLHTVKVVIVGQDPYHNHNQAHGLAFSVRPPTPAPPSLRNMYICLRNDYPSFAAPARNAGLLTPWADRGVLLLNTCLTVRAHEAYSHANRGWERFTQRVLDVVAARRSRGVVFMAWGTPAGKRVQRVDAARHLVLRAAHPSPLSASRGFFDCGHFRKANEWLAARYGAEEGPVDWSLTPGESVLEPAGKGGKEEEEALEGAEAAEKVEKVEVPGEADAKVEKGAAVEVKAVVGEMVEQKGGKAAAEEEKENEKAEAV